MKGTRPLDNDEIKRVSNCFDGIFEARNRGLFMIGVSTGGRISELLSLKIGDVYQKGQAVTEKRERRNPIPRTCTLRIRPLQSPGEYRGNHRNHQDRISSGKFLQ